MTIFILFKRIFWENLIYIFCRKTWKNAFLMVKKILSFQNFALASLGHTLPVLFFIFESSDPKNQIFLWKILDLVHEKSLELSMPAASSKTLSSISCIILFIIIHNEIENAIPYKMISIFVKNVFAYFSFLGNICADYIFFRILFYGIF